MLTTRALIKNAPSGHAAARASLMDDAPTGTLGGRRVRVLVEPLLRRRERGLRRQSLRLVLDDADRGPRLGPADVVARTAAGEVLDTEVVAGPAGSVRLLVPEAGHERRLEILVPALDPDRGVQVVVAPPREWTIHLVHHSHLDIGYTDPQRTVVSEHVAFLDACLDLTSTTAGWPDDAQFRWAVESLWSFEQWRQVRPAAKIDQLVERVRDGHIELTAMPYNLHTDTCSTDELHELLRLARDVRSRYGIEFTSAMQTDVPGTVAGLPDALAQVGVRYLSVAHNWAGRSVPHLNGGGELPRLFRWKAPSGVEVLVWMTDSPHGLAYMEGPLLGFDTSYELVDDLLPAYLTSLATNPYPYPGHIFGWSLPGVVGDREPYPWDVLHLRVQGHFADNAPPRLIMAETVRQWNETWEYPRLRMSRNEDFFRDAEQRVGDQIATYEGDWGDWWVDGVGSGARPQALTRGAQATVTDAQTLSSFARFLGGSGVSDEDERSRGVYEAMSLFNEHTWGAGAPWSDGDDGMRSGEQQWHWKYGCALRAIERAEAFLDDATARLGAALGQGTDALATFHVVNTEAWPRTGVARLFLPESRVPAAESVGVIDARTGKLLPLDVVGQTNPKHRRAGRFLYVKVDDVPAGGLVRVDVVPAPPPLADAGDGHADRPAVLVNEHLRVEVDLTGACVASIVEQATGRELVNQEATVGFNAYVYDTYTTAGGTPLASGVVTVSDELELLGSRSLARPAALVEVTSTPTEQRLAYEFTADGVRWLRVTLRLPHDSAVLHIENRLAKPTTMTKESAYIAFPFAVAEPRVRYEISGAATGSGLDHVPGAPQHMRAIRSWVSMHNDDIAIAWATRDAPLVQPEVIALPYAPFPDSTAPREPATLYSWVHNNIWDTNFPSEQGFETSFNYAVGVARAGERLSPSGLGVRTAAELTNPLLGVLATGGIEADAAEQSLLQVDDDRVRVVSVVATADGAAVVVRLQSFADEPVRVLVRPGVAVAGAQRVTYLGDPDGPATGPVGPGGAVEVAVPRLGVAAMRLDLAPVEACG